MKNYNFGLNKIYNLFIKTLDSFYYYTATRPNRYPCKLVSEMHVEEEKNTQIAYKFVGKREIHVISIKELLDDKILLAKFHPSEAVKFGAIAMGDVLCSLPEEMRVEKFRAMKKKMLFD